MPDFCHLHCHTQYSLLDGAAFIPDMMKKAAADGMKALAITDHGNMFGAFDFYLEAKKHNLQPIIGCEFYLVEDRFRKEFKNGARDQRFHQLLLAKNQEGYQNLAKLCSLGYIDGMYSKYPRIDKKLLSQFKDGLIATSCCIGAEIPQAIINRGEAEAEKIFLEWLDLFGDDFFIELQRHHIHDIDGTGVSQEDVNQVLLRWSQKYNVPVICTNDSHYVDQTDADIHDILLCVNSGEQKATPIGDGKGYRFGFPNDQFYFKTRDEMAKLFHDVPQALDNTMMILDRIDTPKLSRDVMMPNYIIPGGFETQDDYLRHLTFEGARKRYGELSQDVVDRLEFELATIRKSGFPGYFLIVQDFTTAAREMGVMVGPGRGSAAGSAVAYCLGITNVDPVKHDLLFERFLNPERVSMPDIDIDFDDEGRDRVLKYVANKYGQQRIAQIVTYGTMAARSSIKDVGRVLAFPLKDTDRLSKMVPAVPGIELQDLLNKKPDELRDKIRAEDFPGVEELRKVAMGSDDASQVVQKAAQLEGSIRNTGVHACGLVIAPDDLVNVLPVATSKDSSFLLTQYDVTLIEKAGLLKMDFLGLKTLTILKKACEIIKARHGVDIDLDTIPLDDAKTFELFQKGETNGIFQFESLGMQKHLKELKPTHIDDLIAMNALYRPGPMEYIPKYVARKHGREKVVYDLPDMEEFLKETYGITVYQEQVMLLSQKLAGFSKGKADILRKAMGKKDRKTLDDLKPEFMEACKEKGYDLKVCEKIWTDWEAFASYAFNKSHSTCYAYVAYQTMYLKAHYPHEFMSSLLINNSGDIKKVTFFMEECRRMGIRVLGPDVNESQLEFGVTRNEEIRFGLGAIKGVGEAAALAVIEERNSNGPYSSIYDVAKRVNLRMVNKRTLEAMVQAGAFDFDTRYHRQQYLSLNEKGESGIDLVIRFGAKHQENASSMQASLFGGSAGEELKDPELPKADKLSLLEELKLEKDVVGFFISGHPLDTYKTEVRVLAKNTCDQMAEIMEQKKQAEVKLVGIVSAPKRLRDKRDQPFGIFTLEDYTGSAEFRLFKDDYLNFGKFLEPELFVFLKASWQKRNYGEDWEWKVTSMQLLDGLLEKMVSKIQIRISLDNLHDGVADNLQQGLVDFPGKVRVGLELTDSHENLRVNLAVDSGRVKVCPELLELLDEYNLDYTFQ